MKKIHRFLLAQPLVLPITAIDDSRIVHQVHTVLRLEPGEDIIVFWDKGPDVVVTITSLTKHSITVTEREIRDNIRNPKRTVIAAVSIPKGDTFELIVQKLTELGVTTIVPIISARTIKHSVRLDRLQAISDEALEQSGGSIRVTIAEACSLGQALARFPLPGYVLGIPQEAPTALPVATYPEKMIVYIGPEGGWSPEEEIWFSQNSINAIYLGNRVLRTETAAIAGCYQLLWHSSH